jgi:hypothetical protein
VSEALHDAVLPTQRAPHRRRRVILAGVIAGVLGAAGLAEGVTLAHLDGQYRPLASSVRSTTWLLTP